MYNNLSSCAVVALSCKYRQSCVLEMRKKKSRDAARHRRGKENCEFYELSKLLPLPTAITSQLDKASIIRLSISYLKLRTFSFRYCPSLNLDRPQAQNSSTMEGLAKERAHCRWAQTSDYALQPTATVSCHQTDDPHAASVNWSSSSPMIDVDIAFDTFDSFHGPHLLQSLDGFVFAASRDGRFLYVSETVSVYLGLSQVEMIGSDMFDYVHADDRELLAEMCHMTTTSCSAQWTARNKGKTRREYINDEPVHCERMETYRRSFYIRMKSTLVKRGAMMGKTNGFKVVQITAQLTPIDQWSSSYQNVCGLVAVAVVLPSPSGPELLIDGAGILVMRLTAEFYVTYCEPRTGNHVGLRAGYLQGRSLYTCCHPADVCVLQQAHIELMDRGQSMTSYYRLLSENGGYVWMQSCFCSIDLTTASLTVGLETDNAHKMTHGLLMGTQPVIAINYTLSGIEHGGTVMSVDQYDVKQYTAVTNTMSMYCIARGRNTTVAETKTDNNCAMSLHVDNAHSGSCISSPSNAVKQLLDLDALCVVEMEMTSLNNDDTSCVTAGSTSISSNEDDVTGEMIPQIPAVGYVSCIVRPKSSTCSSDMSSGSTSGSRPLASLFGPNRDHVTLEPTMRPSFIYYHEYDNCVNIGRLGLNTPTT